MQQAGAIYAARERGAFDVELASMPPDEPEEQSPATSPIIQQAHFEGGALELLAFWCGCGTVDEFVGRYA